MFTLDKVVPWGRSFDEYRRMFALTPEDLDRRILGCSDGPASFNAEATQRGHRIVSCDPIYRFTREQLETRFAATYDEVLEQTRLNAHEFVWDGHIRSVEELGQMRMAAIPSCSASLSIASPCTSCVASPAKSASFRCSPSAARDRPLSTSASKICETPAIP
jgi:hypothetical protein